MVNIKEKLGEGWLHCRVIIEIAGQPKEHVEKVVKEYVEKIKKEKDMEVLNEKIAELKKQETGARDAAMLQEMWATFAEMEILFKDPKTMTYFCFDYMPSSIEIIEPKELRLKETQISSFLNDLQAKLHKLDMAVKQLNNEGMFLKKNLDSLFRNFVSVLLFNSEMGAEQLSQVVGVGNEELEKFLEKLIKEGKVIKKGDKYSLVRKQ